MTKLIIDADTGSDDAVAILMAYRNLSEKDILGVTVVSGNVPLEQGLLNTIFVNELCDVSVPIYRGASKPLERDYVEVYKTDEANKIALSYENYSTSAQHVHGVDGLGDIGIKPEGNNIEKETAQEFYSMVLDSEDELEIVTLGPLTNIAELVRNNQDKLSKIKHCYITVSYTHLTLPTIYSV